MVRGKLCIHGVTVLDEYITVVDNNTFSNLMAHSNLLRATDLVKTLRERASERFHDLADKISLHPQQIKDWQRAAEQMYILYSEKLGVRPQYDNFLDKQVWDFQNTPTDQYPPSSALSPVGNPPPSGDQTGGSGVGDVFARPEVFPRAKTALLLLLRYVDYRGFLTLCGHSDHNGRRDRSYG